MKQSTLDALTRYRDGNPYLGGFLSAVVANDLLGAVTRADPDNLRDLKEIVLWLHNETPTARTPRSPHA